jgi:putative SOS response-associated peptidase YedK
MCNRYTPARGADLQRDLFGAPVVNVPPEAWARRRIGPNQRGLFLRPKGSAVVEVVGLWGLIRPGSSGELEMVGGRPRMTNNARFETVATKPTFRQAWARGQRCLIPAWGFDEPNWESGKNVWWEMSRADGNPWAIAGLWSEWTNPQTGEIVPSYTMITINADHHPLMRRLHKPDPNLPPDAQDKRSVVPLAPESWKRWLYAANDEATNLLVLPPESTFLAGPAPRVA